MYTKQTKFIKLFKSLLSILQRPLASENNCKKQSFISQTNDQGLDSAQ